MCCASIARTDVKQYNKLLHQRARICTLCNCEILKNEFSFWNVQGILNTSGLLQEIRSIHDSMNIPKIEFIAHIYIL